MARGNGSLSALQKTWGRPAALWIRDLELDVHKLGADSLGLSELAGHAHLTRPAPISGAVLDEVAQLALGKRPGKNDAAPGAHSEARNPVSPHTRGHP